MIFSFLTRTVIFGGLASAMARDVLGWSEEELNTVKNGSPNGQNEFVEWVMDTMARNMNTELAKAAGATNGGVKKDDKLMQKISGPSHINIRDFTAILQFQERHPDLFTDTTIDPRNKDAAITLAKSWLFEDAELASGKRSNVCLHLL